MNDTEDEMIFFEPKKKKRGRGQGRFPEIAGHYKSNGKNPKSASFNSSAEGVINNKRAI